jgi:hypothetical protein
MSNYIQANQVVIQPPSYLRNNKTSLLTEGLNDFTLGKNSSSSCIFTDDEIKSNKPLKHVKFDGAIIDYLTTSNLADLETEESDQATAVPGSLSELASWLSDLASVMQFESLVSLYILQNHHFFFSIFSAGTTILPP